MPIYCKNLKNKTKQKQPFLRNWLADFNESWYKASGLKVKVIFYLDQHDHNQRSFIKDQISGERSKDHSFGYT